MTHDYDISLLFLTTPFTFSSSINKINLQTTDNIAVNTIATVSGWGLTSEDGEPSTELKFVEVPIVGRVVCQSLYYDFSVTNQMICAGWTLGGMGSCQGDSGGPLTVGDKLVGVVSWGVGCAIELLDQVCILA